MRSGRGRVGEREIVTWNVQGMSVRENNRNRMRRVVDRITREGWEVVIDRDPGPGPGPGRDPGVFSGPGPGPGTGTGSFENDPGPGFGLFIVFLFFFAIKTLLKVSQAYKYNFYELSIDYCHLQTIFN